jgi:hypothetical protein
MCQEGIGRPLKNARLWAPLLSPAVFFAPPSAAHIVVSVPALSQQTGRQRLVTCSPLRSLLRSRLPASQSPAYAPTLATAAARGGPAARLRISCAARFRFTVITFSSTCIVTLLSPQ